MSAEHLSLLNQATHLAREWDDLAHEAAWNHHQLLKGRITEEAAREAIRSATPDDTFGQLINSLIAESNNILEDLDEIILAAEEIAGGMQRVAPWED
jgi:DNA-binding transcriptional regulator PaaX